MKSFSFLAILLLSTQVFAVDMSFNFKTDIGRNTTGHNLNMNSLKFSAEVVDFNRPGLVASKQPDQFRALASKKHDLGLFEGEIQGIRSVDDPESRNLFSYMRNRYTLFEGDSLKISFQSQLYSLKDDQRPSLGLPVELRLNEKNSAGLSLLVEQGKYLAERVRKEMLNMYYAYRFFPGYSANISLYQEHIRDLSASPLTQLSAGLSYQGPGSLRIMIGTSTARTGETVVWNHTAGASITF